MEVRICPKCGTENKTTYISCVNCRASLNGVPRTQAGSSGSHASITGATQHLQAPVQPNPTIAAPQPVPGPQPTQAMPNSAVYAQQGQYPPYPAKRKSPAVTVGAVIGVLFLVVMGYMLWLTSLDHRKPEVGPDEVFNQFMRARSTRKLESIMPYLSSGSKDIVKKLKRNQAIRAMSRIMGDEMTIIDSMLFGMQPEGSKLMFGKQDRLRVSAKIIRVEYPERDEKTALVRIQIIVLPDDPQPATQGNPGYTPVYHPPAPQIAQQPAPQQPRPDAAIALVREYGEWRIDLNLTASYQMENIMGPKY